MILPMKESNPSVPLVSIIIPTYNQANVLPLAINSCLAQTYSRIEIIVSDDYSPDDTMDVMSQFKSCHNVRYYRQARNIGRVSNYRKLLNDYATGEWVVNLDGDDYYNDTTFIERAIDALNKSGDIDSTVFIMSGKVVLDKVQGYSRNRPVTQSDYIFMPGKEYFQHAYFDLENFSHSAALYRRAKAILLPFYCYDSLNTDAHSFLRLSLTGSVILLGGTPLTWILHGNNQSNKYGLSQEAPEWQAMVDVANFSRNYLSQSEVNQWLHKLTKREYKRRINEKVSHLTKRELLNYIVSGFKFDITHIKLLIKKIIVQ